MDLETLVSAPSRVTRHLPSFCPHVSFLLALLISCLPALAGKVKYTYDTAGRLTAADHGNNTFSTFLYDKNGNLLNHTTAMPTNADVRVAKTSGFLTFTNVTSLTVGTEFFYLVSATNAGPNAATGVTLSDALPFGMVLRGVSLSQGTFVVSNHTVICNLGILPVGTAVSLTVTTLHAFAATNFTNTATLAATQTDPLPANNTARFVTAGTGQAPDSDNDGMPNWWEQRHNLSIVSTNNPNGPNHDPDGDGVSNFDEWIADTNPRDANSKFEIMDHVFEAGAGGFSLTIQSSPVRQYVLEFTEDLSQPFAPVETVNGTGGPITFSHTSGTARGYYRVRVGIPEL